MNNFRFTKIIAGVSPTLAKETVLSKIINMVDAFRITLSKGYDDNNKKYIDTLMKLDNSKTIILETKGIDIRIKNTTNIPVKKGQKVTIEYSEYVQEADNKIYIDYPKLEELKIGEFIHFHNSKIIAKIEESSEDSLEAEIIEAKTPEILQYDRVCFEGIDSSFDQITERDKKDILRGLEYGTHVIGLSCSTSANHIISTREFLEISNVPEMKIFAKIETKTWWENLEEISTEANGIIFVVDSLAELQDNETLLWAIRAVKKKGKPVLLCYTKTFYNADYSKHFTQQIQAVSKEGIDGIMMEPFILEDDVFDAIEKSEDILASYELKLEPKEIARFEDIPEFEVRDYIIYNAFRTTKELGVRAVICFSENGYTASRLSSLIPSIPIITFTQSKETYRYLSLVWGIKGYKISQSFNYENLKRIGKEMIRIIFKGNISLDDKILILQANELSGQNKNNMINGIEAYNFKNI